MLKPLAKLGKTGLNKGISYYQRYTPVSKFGGGESDPLSPLSPGDGDDRPCATPPSVSLPKRIEPLVGTLASQYDTLRVIHDGGDQCRVIRVRSRDDGAVYVMKIVDKKLLRCQKEALFREMTMRLMNTLESEHIVQIHGCFEDSDNFYILQEACEGGNLVDLLRLLESVNQGMDVETLEDEVRQAVGELLLSLDHLHKKGLIHKDVKLENAVFKTKRSITTKNPNLSKYLKVPRVLKLIDFDYLLDWKRNKRSKDVLGTDGYIAPEAYLGYACPKSDVFSAGVVMFLLISGRFPFDDEIFDDCANQNYPGHPKMQEIYDKLEQFEVRYGKSWKHMDQAKDFCKTLLEFSVDKRPNAEEALKHPWMAKFVEEMKLPMVKEEVATNAKLAASKASQGSQETMKTLTRRQTIA